MKEQRHSFSINPHVELEPNGENYEEDDIDEESYAQDEIQRLSQRVLKLEVENAHISASKRNLKVNDDDRLDSDDSFKTYESETSSQQDHFETGSFQEDMQSNRSKFQLEAQRLSQRLLDLELENQILRNQLKSSISESKYSLPEGTVTIDEKQRKVEADLLPLSTTSIDLPQIGYSRRSLISLPESVDLPPSPILPESAISFPESLNPPILAASSLAIRQSSNTMQSLELPNPYAHSHQATVAPASSIQQPYSTRIESFCGLSTQAYPPTSRSNLSSEITSEPRSPPDINFWVGTWNLGAKDPFQEKGKRLANKEKCSLIIKNLIPLGYHMYIIGVQEAISENIYHAIHLYLNSSIKRSDDSGYVRLLVKKTNFISQPSRQFDGDCDKVSGRGDGALLQKKFTGIAVFIRTNLSKSIKLIRAASHKFNATSGSKGGVAVALRVRSQANIVFVNCHLEPNHDAVRREQMIRLNNLFGKLLGQKSGVTAGPPCFDLTNCFHHVVWMGHLNYKICTLSSKVVLQMLKEGKVKELHDKFDGLVLEQKQERAFVDFHEPKKGPTFYPTYRKFAHRGEIHEAKDSNWPSRVYQTEMKQSLFKGRKVKSYVPGWCDRILIHSICDSSKSKSLSKLEYAQEIGEDGKSLQDIYHSINNGVGMDISDHSPVSAAFWLRFPNTLAVDFEEVYNTSPDDTTCQAITTIFQVANVFITCDSGIAIIPNKVRLVSPLLAEDLPHPLAHQVDVLDEPHSYNNTPDDENFSTTITLNHVRPLNELHLLIWVQYEGLFGHIVSSLEPLHKSVLSKARVNYKEPLWNQSKLVDFNGELSHLSFTLQILK